MQSAGCSTTPSPISLIAFIMSDMQSKNPGLNDRFYLFCYRIALPVFALVSGCVFKEPFPDDWGKLPDISDNCPNIAGVYRNVGQINPSEIEKGQYSAYWEIPLTGELFDEDTGAEVVSATHVKVAQPEPGSITVTAWNEHKLMATANYTRIKGDFECESGFVVFKAVTNCGGTPEAFGCGSRVDHFSKSNDGALILKVNEWGAAAVMVIVPAVVSDWRWYRFELMAQ